MISIKKFKNIIQQQLSQGTTKEKVAQSITIGVIVGVFPTLGVSSLMAVFFGHFLKLNHIVVQATNYLMYPIQLLLIPLYIKLLSVITGQNDLPIRPDLIIELFFKDMKNFFHDYGLITIYAIILWTIVSLVFYPICNYFLIRLFTRSKK